MDRFTHYLSKLNIFKRLKTSLTRELTPEEKLARDLQPYHRYLYKFQELVVWKEPPESILAIFLVNVAYLALNQIQWRFFGILFTVLLALVTNEFWSYLVGNDIIHIPKDENPSPDNCESKDDDYSKSGLLTVPELSHHLAWIQRSLSSGYRRLKAMRTKQPSLYCGIVCGCCGALALLGTLVSGLGLVYTIFIGVFTLPGAYIKLLSPESKQRVQEILTSFLVVFYPPDDKVSVEGFVPEENLDLLNAPLAAKDPDEGSRGSTTDESIVGIPEGDMPPFDESDTMDSLDLDPRAVSHLLSELSSGQGADSDPFEIQFKSTHFNGAGSSADDETRLLPTSFTDVEIVSTLSAALRRSIASTFSRTPPPPPPRRRPSQDSDSEFEVIDSDELPS